MQFAEAFGVEYADVHPQVVDTEAYPSSTFPSQLSSTPSHVASVAAGAPALHVS